MNEKSTETIKGVKCPTCGRSFNCPSAVTNHRKVREANKYSCKYCCGSFLDPQQRRKHHKKFHYRWPETDPSITTISDQDKIFYHITGQVPPPIEIVRDFDSVSSVSSSPTAPLVVSPLNDCNVVQNGMDLTEDQGRESVLGENGDGFQIQSEYTDNNDEENLELATIRDSTNDNEVSNNCNPLIGFANKSSIASTTNIAQLSSTSNTGSCNLTTSPTTFHKRYGSTGRLLKRTTQPLVTVSQQNAQSQHNVSTIMTYSNTQGIAEEMDSFLLEMLLLCEPTEKYLDENRVLLSLLLKPSNAKSIEDWKEIILLDPIKVTGVLPFCLLLFDSIRLNGLDFASNLYNLVTPTTCSTTTSTSMDANTTESAQAKAVEEKLKQKCYTFFYFGLLFSFYREISKSPRLNSLPQLIRELKNLPKCVAVYFGLTRFLKLISKLCSSVQTIEESERENDNEGERMIDVYYREMCNLKDYTIEKICNIGQEHIFRETATHAQAGQEDNKDENTRRQEAEWLIWTEMLNKQINSLLSLKETTQLCELSLFQICVESTMKFTPLSKPFVHIVLCKNLPTCKENEHMGFDLFLHNTLANLKTTPAPQKCPVDALSAKEAATAGAASHTTTTKTRTIDIVKVQAEDVLIFLRLFYNGNVVNVLPILNKHANICHEAHPKATECFLIVENQLALLKKGLHCSFPLFALAKAVGIKNPIEFLNLQKVDWKALDKNKRSDLFKIYAEVYGLANAFTLIITNAPEWYEENFVSAYLDGLDKKQLEELFSSDQLAVDEIIVYDCLKNWSVRKAQSMLPQQDDDSCRSSSNSNINMALDETARKLFQSVCQCIRLEFLGKENYSRIVSDFFLPVDLIFKLEELSETNNDSADMTTNKRKRTESNQQDNTN